MTTLTKTANDIHSDLLERLQEARTAKQPKLIEFLKEVIDAVLLGSDLHSCSNCNELIGKDEECCFFCIDGEQEPEGIEGRRDFYNQR